MDPARAADAANYTLTQFRRRGRQLVARPVAVRAAYDATAHSVTLTLAGRPEVRRRGASWWSSRRAPGGLTDAAGTPLDGGNQGTLGDDGTFVIARKGSTPSRDEPHPDRRPPKASDPMSFSIDGILSDGPCTAGAGPLIPDETTTAARRRRPGARAARAAAAASLLAGADRDGVRSARSGSPSRQQRGRRVNPATHVVTEITTPTADSDPIGIAAGPDGNLWFTEANANRIG